jgi:D-alanine-D-alanine ligase
MSIAGKKITVLKGGPGSEREISLATARSVVAALAECGAEVTEVDVIGPDFEVPADCDLAFNCIHGTFGEDGQLQRILNQRRIPYTGAGAASSELAFDKVLSKKRFIENLVPTPLFELLVVREGSDPGPVAMPLPFVVKPPKEGSSVGVHIVREEEEVAPALADVAKYDAIALVEEFVSGKELTVGILGDDALPVIHICPKSGFYDLKNKYPWLTGEGGTEYICPAELDPETTRAVQEAALAAHRALGIEVYSRVDLLLDEANRVYVLEVNTIPGMTSSSLLPKAARVAGIEFPELCRRIAETSLRIRPKR